MKIVLINAAAPDFNWQKSYRPADFEQALREWEQAPVALSSAISGKADGYHIYQADSLHAAQTARLWLGEAAECFLRQKSCGRKRDRKRGGS